MYIDLAALWQSANAFVNSNVFTAIAGSCAGAFFGAYGAQRIAARGKEREELLTEIRNTNAAVMVAFAICNAFLVIKKQHIKSFKDAYDSQKAAYFDHAQKRGSGQISADTPFEFVANLQSLFVPPFPLDILRQQVFEKLFLNGRPLLLTTALSDTVFGLNTSVDNRNKLIEFYKQQSISPQQLVSLYFGLRQQNTHVVNQEYPSLMDAIYRQTDDGIFYSHLLCTDLFDHGRELARRFKARFGKDAPTTLNKPDFSDQSALMPNVTDYADWFNLIIDKQKGPFNTPRQSRGGVFTILARWCRFRAKP